MSRIKSHLMAAIPAPTPEEPSRVTPADEIGRLGSAAGLFGPRGRTAPARAVLEALRQFGPTARIDLARRLGASAAAMSALTGSLVERGILAETAAFAGPLDVRPARGRPPVLLDFAPDAGAVVSIRISLDRVQLGLADARGVIGMQREVTVGLHRLEPEPLIDALSSVIDRFIEATPAPDRVRGIAIAFQGFVDADRGVVVWSPVLACRNLPLAERLSERLGRPVDIENDAGALALSLARRSPAYARGRTASILIGQGVGLGLMFDGRLYRGVRSGGSEYGHIRIGAHGPQCRCGSRGCIEASVADYALYHQARIALGEPEGYLGDPTEAEMADLVRLGLDGNPRVVALFQSAASVLAEGIAILIQLLQPDHVLISGPGVRAEPLLAPRLRDHLATVMIPEILDQTTVVFEPFEGHQIMEGVLQRGLARLDDVLSEAVAR